MRRRHLVPLATLLLAACTTTGGGPSARAPSRGGDGPNAVEYDVGRDLGYSPAVGLADEDRTLVVVTRDGEVLAMDVATRALLGARRHEGLEGAQLITLAPATGTVAWVADGAVHVGLLGPLEVAGVAARAQADPVEPEVLEDGADVTALSLSPAGDALAIARASGQVEVRSVPGLSLVACAPLPPRGPRRVEALSWEASGTFLAAAGQGGLSVHAAQDLRPLRTAPRSARLLAAAFSPDGRSLAFGGDPREVEVMDLLTGTTRVLVKLQPFGTTTLAYSPDGQILAAGDESCDVWAYDANSGRRVMHGKHHVECYVTTTVWSADGTLLFGCRPHGPGREPVAPDARPEPPPAPTETGLDGVEVVKARRF